MGGLYPSTGSAVGALGEFNDFLNFPIFSTVARSKWVESRQTLFCCLLLFIFF